MAANRKGIGLTMLKHACNSTRNKYLLVVMHKTLCSVWLTFVRRENEAVQNCPIVLKNSSSSSSSSYYYYSYFAVTHKLHKLHSQLKHVHKSLHLYYSLHLSRKAHDTYDSSFQGQRQFLTALAIETVQMILNSANYK